ncbi:AAA family ATPase [Amycolatopsis japonica]|uniref:helix-turn-helix transcriptional regulator n=1 Tax=Amycolatopsis japonica TaxID=208439 RepID=UPI00331F2C45
MTSTGVWRDVSPLVGRKDELEVLRLAVRRRPAVVHIEGEAGVGKSRLVRELVASVDQSDVTVLVGSCQQFREPFILGAVLEALRRCREPLRRCTELSPVTAALRAAVPELAEVLPEPLSGMGDPLFDRHLLFRAIREVLAVLGPTLLVIEDLHWADDGTLQLLRFLMADPPPDLAVVVTYRREDVPGGMPMGRAYRPAANALTELVRLEPLTVGQVRALAGAAMGTDKVSVEFAAELHEYTAGLPFVVVEALRAMSSGPGGLVANSAAVRRLSAEGEVPVLLLESVAERLSVLSPNARRFVRAAAVLAVPASSELIGDVAGLCGDDLRAAAVEVFAGSLLHDVGNGRLTFRHTLARQAVYRTVSVLDRRDLHEGAVLTLSALERPPLVQLAEHCRLAGRHADWLRYGEAAADQALVVSDAAAAIPLLRRLLAEPWLSGADVDRLGVKLGEVSALGLDSVGPASALKRLLGDDRLSESARGEVRMLLGMLLAKQRDGVTEARAQMALAVDELSGRPDLAAKAMSMLAQPFIGDTPLDQVTPWLHKADAALGGCDAPTPRISLMANVIGSLVAIGDPSMHERLAAVPASGYTLPEQRQLARAHSNLADSMTTIGLFGTAREYLRAGISAAEETGSLYVLSGARSTEIRLDWFTGVWEELDLRARSLLAEYRELAAIADELNLVLGLHALARGERVAARAHFDDTDVRCPQNAITPVALGCSAGLVRLALQDDDAVLAGVEADAGMALLRGKGVWAWAGELAPAAVDAYLFAGRVRDAELVVRDLSDGLRGTVAPLAAAALDTCRGALADHVGQDGGELHEAAGHAYEEMGASYLATAARERAEAHRLRAGDDAAVEALSRTAERYEAFGATHDAARCRRLLRGLGVRTTSRTGRRGYGTELSPREKEVARLMAAGDTNNEIAEVLFLSIRTVEQHAARVLRKLGTTRQGLRNTGQR